MTVSKGAERHAEASPIFASDRLDTLDVLRGFAVLAIFIVNVKMMANGFNHYRDASLWNGEVAQLITFLHSRFVHGKFVTIFTALFGAGLALLLARSRPVPLYIVVRRLFWLGVFGTLHLVFLREGDILVWYAMAGVVALPFTWLSSRTLFLAGFVFQALAFSIYNFVPSPEVDIPTLWQTTPDAHRDVAVIMLGSLGDQVAARAETMPYYLFYLFILEGVWIDTLSVMLLGMALLKTGFLSGRKTPKQYLFIGVLSLCVAFGRDVLIPHLDSEDGFQALMISAIGQAHYLAAALTWSCAIIGAVVMGWPARRFAAVGRTAFTIYILESAIGLLLFSSLGLGLFGQLSLEVLMAITAAVWIVFLVAAPLWLSRYQYGPLEWLWRSLTYGRRQPWRRATE